VTSGQGHSKYIRLVCCSIVPDNLLVVLQVITLGYTFGRRFRLVNERASCWHLASVFEIFVVPWIYYSVCLIVQN